jgi:hypothetical protein
MRRGGFDPEPQLENKSGLKTRNHNRKNKRGRLTTLRVSNAAGEPQPRKKRGIKAILWRFSENEEKDFNNVTRFNDGIGNSNTRYGCPGRR